MSIEGKKIRNPDQIKFDRLERINQLLTLYLNDQAQEPEMTILQEMLGQVNMKVPSNKAEAMKMIEELSEQQRELATD